MTPEEMEAKIAELSEALTKANGESAERRKTAKELKAKLEAFEGIDPDKYKEFQEKATKAEEERLKQAGQYDQALEEATKGFKAEIETLKGLLQGKDSKLSEVLIDTALLTAIDGKAVNNEHVLALLKSNIKMEGDSPIVMNGDAPLLNEKGEKMSVKEYASDFLNKNPHFVKAGAPGSGSKGNGGEGGVGGKEITREAFDKLDPASQAQHFKDGGKVTD